MNRKQLAWRGLWLGLIGTAALLAAPRAEPQTPGKPKTVELLKPPLPPGQSPQALPKVTPRLEPVAETRLIMEGMAHTNFRGLERLLAERPTEAKAWQFARGQA